MKQFEYDEIKTREGNYETIYECVSKKEYSLLGILELIGYDGWELVGEVQGKLIVKREIV